MHTRTALVSLAALGIGVLIGGHLQPRATAGPTLVQGRGQWSEFINSSSEGGMLFQWTMDHAGVTSVTINSLSQDERGIRVLRKQVVHAETEPTPRNEKVGK